MNTQPPYPSSDQNPYPTPIYPTYPSDGPEQAANQPYPEIPPPPPVYPTYSQPLGYPPPQPMPSMPSMPYPMAAYPIPIYQPAEPGAGQAVAGLVLGIVALAMGLLLIIIPQCGIFITGPLGVLGIIFGALGRRSYSRRTMATVGMILSIIALALLVVGIVFIVVLQISIINSTPQPTQ